MTPQEAIEIKQRRRGRVRRIRGRVVGGSVALFLAVWSLIAVVLITGHDPGLAAEAGHRTATATTSTSGTTTSGTATSSATTSSSSTTSTGLGSSGSSDSTGSSAATGSVSAVTSSQS